jgi:hypothetical protein
MLKAPFQLLANGVRAVETMTAFVMMEPFKMETGHPPVSGHG